MKNVVILGAGYAGLTTLKGLKKAAKAGEVKVTLVNKNSYHYDTVNLHEVSAGNIPSRDICIDIKDVVTPGVSFVQDEFGSEFTLHNPNMIEMYDEEDGGCCGGGCCCR